MKRQEQQDKTRKENKGQREERKGLRDKETRRRIQGKVLKVLKIKGLREMEEGKKGLTNGDGNGDLNVENEKGKWKLIVRVEEGEGLTV